jgi:hypothetical protein
MFELLNDQQIDCFYDLGTAAAPVTGLPSESEVGAIMATSQRHGIEVLAGTPAV